MAPAVEVAVRARARLGEGPLWDDRTSLLYWVDILRSEVHCFDPRSGVDTSTAMDRAVGALALDDDGEVLGAVDVGFARLDLRSGRSRVIKAVVHGRGMRMNDGKVDPGGRFWAGSMHTEERRNAGSLYRLEPDGQVTVMIEHVTISNGLAWSPDRQTFYFIDSATREVAAYEHDPSDGSLGARRVAVRIADGAGTPDGMAIDTEGLLWVALWDGWAVHRYAPDGELVDIVEVPVARPTCPVFGGPDLRQLFVTSARLGADKDRAQPLAGSVFVTEVETAGTPCNRVSAAPAA